MEQAGVGHESPTSVQKRLVLGRQQKRLRDFCSANRLQRMPDRESAYGVAKQPRALTGEKWKGERGIPKKKNALEGAEVDLKLIASKEYASSFKGLTGNDAADKAVLQAARMMLTHRSGTHGEDLCLVSIVDGEVKVSVTDSKGFLAVTPTSDILDAVSSNPEGTLFSVHNHPSNIPPIGSDLAVSASRRYTGAIVVLHDGGVYYYKHGDIAFTSTLFDMKCTELVSAGKSQTEAAIEVLDEFKKRHGVKWKKLR